MWSRAARRNPVKTVERKSEHVDDGNSMAFGFKIHVTKLTTNTDDSEVTIRWLKGRDSILFESFCGIVKRNLTT